MQVPFTPILPVLKFRLSVYVCVRSKHSLLWSCLSSWSPLPQWQHLPWYNQFDVHVIGRNLHLTHLAAPPDLAVISLQKCEPWITASDPFPAASLCRRFSPLTFNKPPLSLWRRPARFNRLISGGSPWIESRLPVTDAAVCIVCLISGWTPPSEPQCVVAPRLLMCARVVPQCRLDTRCSPRLPARYSNM